MYEEPPLVVPEAYRYTLKSGNYTSGCIPLGIIILDFALDYSSALDAWVRRQWSGFAYVYVAAILIPVVEWLQPHVYVLDDEGVWRVNRRKAVGRSLTKKAYRNAQGPLLRPSQVLHWEPQRWRGYPTFVITGPDEEQVTICLRRDCPGARHEWEVQRRLEDWGSLPAPDEEQETICIRRDCPSSRDEWEFLRRMEIWGALPIPDKDEDEDEDEDVVGDGKGEYEIHWGEVPKELKHLI